MLHSSAGCLITSCPGLCCPIHLIPSAQWLAIVSLHMESKTTVPRAVRSRF
jgi:hypothetical protein